MDAIEARLIEWGSWASGFGRGGGTTNILARHIANGGIRCASPENWAYLPPDIELTERAIAQLRLKHPHLKKLIFYRYLYHQQPEEMAANLGRSKEHIQIGLDKARDWIGDWIETQLTNTNPCKFIQIRYY